MRFILFGWIKNTNHIFEHLVSQVTPTILIPFIVIKTFSILIRPEMLTVRLTANMIAVHLLLTLLGNNGPSIRHIIKYPSNTRWRKTYRRKDKRDRKTRRHKQLLDDLKETRQYWKLKEEALDCTLWRTCFHRGYGPIVKTMWWWWFLKNCMLRVLLHIYLNKRLQCMHSSDWSSMCCSL